MALAVPPCDPSRCAWCCCEQKETILLSEGDATKDPEPDVPPPVFIEMCKAMIKNFGNLALGASAGSAADSQGLQERLLAIAAEAEQVARACLPFCLPSYGNGARSLPSIRAVPTGWHPECGRLSPRIISALPPELIITTGWSAAHACAVCVCLRRCVAGVQVSVSLYGESMTPRDQQDRMWADGTVSVWDLETMEQEGEIRGEDMPWHGDMDEQIFVDKMSKKKTGFNEKGVKNIGGG